MTARGSSRGAGVVTEDKVVDGLFGVLRRHPGFASFDTFFGSYVTNRIEAPKSRYVSILSPCTFSEPSLG